MRTINKLYGTFVMNNKDRMDIFERHNIKVVLRQEGSWSGISLWYRGVGFDYFITHGSMRGGRYKALRTMFENYKDYMWKKCNE